MVSERDLENQEKLFDEKLGRYTDRLDQQDKRICEVLSYTSKNSKLIALFTILIGFAAASTFIYSAANTEIKIDGWILKEGPKALDNYIEANITERINDRLISIEKTIQKQTDTYLFELRAGLSNQLNANTTPNGDFTQVEKIKTATEDIKAKPTEKRSSEEWFTLGLTYFWGKHFKKAISAFQSASDAQDATQQQIAIALLNKGITLRKNKQLDNAIEAYETVERRFGIATDIKLRKIVANALLNKGVALHYGKQFGGAIKTYEMVVSRFGDSPDLDLQNTVVNAQSNNAFTHVTQAKQVWQGNRGGDTALELLQVALNIVNKAIKRSPGHIKSHINQGLVLFLLGRDDDAAGAYKLAFELGGKDAYEEALSDVDACPDVKAEAFVALVERVWVR